jgi:hypothetical protein
LLNQLRQRFVTTPTVFIDCQVFQRANSYFAEILRQLHTVLTAQGMRGLPVPPLDVDDEQFRQQFLIYFSAWEKTGRREPFLITLDEVDKFFPPREVKGSEEILAEYVRCFRVLRGLAQTRQCLVLLVVAYRPDVNRHNLLPAQVGENPMFSSFQEEYLGFLDAAASAALLRNIGAWKEIMWEDAAVERVFYYCGGHPLVTRFFASQACNEGTRKYIDSAHVEIVAADVQRMFYKNEIGTQYTESIWNILREDEQHTLLLLNQNGKRELAEAAFPAEWREELANLERFGLVANREGQLHITAQLFRTWIQEKTGERQ